MLKYIIIICLFLNGCTAYKHNQLQKEIIKKQQSWLNIQYLAMKKPQLTNKKGTMKKQLNQQLIKDNLLADMKHDNQLKKYVKDIENLDAKQFDVLISIFTKINLNKFKTYLI